MPYYDSFDRPINYLRISVTDRCNLRCVYCMPAEGIPLRPHAEILTYEEIARIVSVVARLGIFRVRLTGGEPLARLGLVDLVAMIREIPGIEEISLTTNGTLLAPQAKALAAAGLDRVNISLDTLWAERYRTITRRGDLADVFGGIMAARREGLEPVKINMVVIRGLNDDEVVDFARRTLVPGWHVRYIEVMPLSGGSHWTSDGFVSNEEIRRSIERTLGSLTPVPSNGGGPARYYRVAGASGTIGFISPWSHHFCHSCNRLRLTADGQLRPCLLSDREIDIRTPLRAGASDAELREIVTRAIAAKPAHHHLNEGRAPKGRKMVEIGG